MKNEILVADTKPGLPNDYTECYNLMLKLMRGEKDERCESLDLVKRHLHKIQQGPMPVAIDNVEHGKSLGNEYKEKWDAGNREVENRLSSRLQREGCGV